MASELKEIESKPLPKGGNSILNNAKYSSANTDEWYTTYETIAEELAHYQEQFRNKIVLCNCDDPYESNFCYYFLKHFNQLQLKKLICTSYAGSKIAQIQANSKLSVKTKGVKGKNKYAKNGYVLIVTEIPGKHGEEVSDEIIKTVIEKKGTIEKLKGSGDFSSDECIEYLKECDICCTNPPFSLFASLFSLLIKYEKQYLLIGNQNAITYKEIFPYIKENKAWVGYRFGDMEDLNYDTIHGYRNSHRSLKEGHPFERLSDHEYLRSIGAAAISEEDGQLHPTAAGMLMFGDEYNIVRQFPEYFLDYREELDPTTRWSDRLQSSSGEWSGNVCDFYFRVYNKIIKDVKVPFKMSGGERVDDTPVHKAIREALANCLINADYHGLRGVVIRKEPDKLVLANPGYIRTGKKQMRLGGESDPRNKTLMKMFNLINIGERAGSGVPNIFNVWADEGLEEPVIEERFDPDRTVLELSFLKKVTGKSDSKKVTVKSDGKKVTVKTKAHYDMILSFMEDDVWYKASELVDVLGVRETRTKALLRALVEDGLLVDNGAIKGRKYKKK